MPRRYGYDKGAPVMVWQSAETGKTRVVDMTHGDELEIPADVWDEIVADQAGDPYGLVKAGARMADLIRASTDKELAAAARQWDLAGDLSGRAEASR